MIQDSDRRSRPVPSAVATRIIRRSAADCAALPPDLHPVLRRVYAGRSLREPRELERALAQLPQPETLAGMAAAAALLQHALEQGRRILVVGDFDADGATSSALAVLGLRALGAAEVDFLTPNRFEYGYGLTPEIVAAALQRAPDLIVTVDNGISSLDGVAAAQAAGTPVLVTDHHLPGETLPAAAALLNPRLDPSFAAPNLAGVGVMFYLLAALRARLRAAGWFEARGVPEPNLAECLDLVALGTVADVVPLDHPNRILVHQGLARMRRGRCRPGILALARVAGRAPERLTAADLGFAIGPRLNAAGRLADMGLGIRCLLTEDPAEAMDLAAQLDGLNRERREIEEGMRQEALAALEPLHAELNPEAMPFGLCLFDAAWHQGVIGILAARLRERFHRPAIVFAPGEAGAVKGSARSVSGLHIRDALNSVAVRHPGLIEKFGGHAMAAGLTLRAEALAEFERAFDQEVRRHLSVADLVGVVQSDGPLEPRDFSLDLAAQLRAAGPWGQGFPEPTFDGRFRVQHLRVLKARHLKLALVPEAGQSPLPAIAFSQAEDADFGVGDWVEAAYRLDLNEYRGEVELQLNVQCIQKANGAPL